MSADIYIEPWKIAARGASGWILDPDPGLGCAHEKPRHIFITGCWRH